MNSTKIRYAIIVIQYSCLNKPFSIKNHKVLLLALMLTYQFSVFGQEGFRGLSWGSSTVELKSQDHSRDYDITLDASRLIHYTTQGYLSGIEVYIDYIFKAGRLYAGAYMLNPSKEYSSTGDWIRDYQIVSKNLNQRYRMWDDYTWHISSFKHNLEYSFSNGYVDMLERCTRESDLAVIHHEMKVRNNETTHFIWYYSPQYVLDRLGGNNVEEY